MAVEMTKRSEPSTIAKAARNHRTLRLWSSACLPTAFESHERPARLPVGRIEDTSKSIRLEADRIVINERTGTIVVGTAVSLLPTAVAHGNLDR
jgi:hypothetical protein